MFRPTCRTRKPIPTPSTAPVGKKIPTDGSLVRRALSEIAKAHGLTFVTRQTELNQPSATSDAFANERDHI